MFERLNLLINTSKLKTKTVLLIGLGGVGGYVFELLVRSGIGHIIIVDGDKIDITNLNRQILSNKENIGADKVDAAKKRALQINPDCEITVINKFITKDNIDLIFKNNIDFLIDAEDTVLVKKLIFEICLLRNINFISSLGMGNRLDASKVKITTLDKTCYDPLAKSLRQYLNSKNISLNIPVVFSSEIPIKSNKVGSFGPVVTCAGALCASYVINKLLEDE